MAEHPIWLVHDLTIILIGLLLVIGIIVIDFLFCHTSHGFCIFKWSWDTLLCKPLLASAKWPPTYAFVSLLCQVGNVIPL
jgi:hypothetical protein